MANQKKCTSCNELKATTQFSKYTKSKDGLQRHCKECQSIRTRPITDALLKADKNGVIYKITNPDGDIYIGKSFRLLKYRFSSHKADYLFYKSHNLKSTFPLLHKSFDKFGLDKHKFELVAEYPNISKEDLRQIETKLIQTYQKNNKSLNTNK